MPSWREHLGKKLSGQCEPKVKLHFVDRTDCDLHDPMFMRILRVFAETRGCSVVNTEQHHNKGDQFSRIMCHDNPRDLASVPAPAKTVKPKKGKSRAKSVGPTPGQRITYQCWTLA
ncbi:unnamed protein product [Polarella glacialis]|uniref:Uncharacterized protein n=1 Tax=Polarella glacialis TaxID=89957 RepID=A0A813LUP6_POLGL|nr:unnamed protein product [Polarella glacialis]CAE8739308.1 unnamed protein product [Polarella glacialis]|mmetsp:Transcript_60647/g.98197  ORF Transcript_60647/g.98197 Transcript_60647/m.98197 type:complete len:116 (-) Transcript_60647:143-490(-)